MHGTFPWEVQCPLRLCSSFTLHRSGKEIVMALGVFKVLSLDTEDGRKAVTRTVERFKTWQSQISLNCRRLVVSLGI